MTDETETLEDPDTWDWETAERRPAVPGAGVVVSVRYTTVEFEAIAASAEQQHLSIMDYIRRVVLEAARGHTPT